MAVTVEEVRSFIEDAKKSRKNWLTWAGYSWGELKKVSKQGNLWSLNPNSVAKRSRYPAWYSIFKIRQPLLLSRVGVPIGKDTTQDGRDNVGATAAICLERLAVNLAKTFNFFDVCAAARDDFLATNFGLVRGYYERDTIKEYVKEYITPQPAPEGEGMIFVGADGVEITTDDIYQDDQGYFIKHEQTVDIDNERILLEPVLYREVLIDPDIRHWGRCKRICFECSYSEYEFKRVFGITAYNDIAKQVDKQGEDDESYPKKQDIKVYEYWDWYEKKCYWLAEFGSAFIEPKAYYSPENDDADDEPLNGLYNLDGFFPCPPPLLMNAPTDDFWPVPEYYQVVDIINDIHNIFSCMMGLTRSIRPRLLFDSNVDGLQAALNEAASGDAFGVPNLAQSLSGAGGSLDSVVQYIPVEKMIEALAQNYTALEQRLQVLFKLTGTSDLLQGLSTTNTDKTLGERQMEEKYAINQIAEAQRKMAEFVRDAYQLICEMAIKNFKESSLDMYTMPQTLTEEHQRNYKAAIGMLKDNTKRFRIELETDSTIAINEAYDKKMRIELVNTLTAAIEHTGQIYQQQPALFAIEAHALKFLIQGMRQSKMFQAEITEALDNVIKQAESAPPGFNKDQAMMELENKKLQASNALEQYKIQSDERIAVAKLQQDAQMASIQNQLESFKVQSEASANGAELQLKYQQLSAEISEAQQKLMLERDALMVELRKIADKKEVDQYALMIDERVAVFEQQLATAQQQLEAQKVMLDEREKYMTEARLQSEHELQQLQSIVEMQVKKQEALQSQIAQAAPPAPVVNVHMPPNAQVKRKSKIKRDAEGNMVEIEQEDVQDIPTGL